MTVTTSPVALAMSEDELSEQVADYARDLRLLAYHTYRSTRSTAGYPDWTITGPGGVLFRELKREGGRVTGPQQKWLDTLTAAGADAALWTPTDLLSGRIIAEMWALR